MIYFFLETREDAAIQNEGVYQTMIVANYSTTTHLRKHLSPIESSIDSEEESTI
jgi:hypothetical protein